VRDGSTVVVTSILVAAIALLVVLAVLAFVVLLDPIP
jgi:hypothetical protein